MNAELSMTWNSLMKSLELEKHLLPLKILITNDPNHKGIDAAKEALNTVHKNTTQLLDFIIRLSSIHTTVKFDFNYSESSLEFFRYKILKIIKRTTYINKYIGNHQTGGIFWKLPQHTRNRWLIAYHLAKHFG